MDIERLARLTTQVLATQEEILAIWQAVARGEDGHEYVELGRFLTVLQEQLAVIREQHLRMIEMALQRWTVPGKEAP